MIKRITDKKIIEEIIKKYLNGIAIKPLSIAYQISCRQIRNILNKENIKLRNVSESAIQGYKLGSRINPMIINFTQNQKDDIVKKYLAGIPPKIIGKSLGHDSKAIIRILKENKITLRNISESQSLSIKLGRKDVRMFLGHHHSELSKSKTRAKLIGINSPFFKISKSEAQKIKMRKPRTTTIKMRKPKSLEGRKNMSYVKKRLFAEGKLIMPSGENSSNWKGGLSFEPYGIEFNNSLKKSIRARDQKCIICEIAKEYALEKINNQDIELWKKAILKLNLEIKSSLHTHHIDYNKKNNQQSNLISLCINHHLQTNSNREKWKIILQRIMNTRYGFNYPINNSSLLLK